MEEVLFFYDLEVFGSIRSTQPTKGVGAPCFYKHTVPMGLKTMFITLVGKEHISPLQG